MPSVKVVPVPAHKLNGACDAGLMHMNPRDQVLLDDDGCPVIDEGTGHEKTARVRRPPSRKWVGSNGTVFYARISGGSGFYDDPNADSAMSKRLYNSKAIRYDLCPLHDPNAYRWLPKEMRGHKPCDRKSYGLKKCCPHVEQIIEQRREAHLRRESLQEEKFQSEIKLQMKGQQQQHAETMQALTKLANAFAQRTTEVSEE